MQIKSLKTTLLLLAISTSTLLSGCSTKQVIPDTGEEIIDIYNKHVGSTKSVNKMFRELRYDRRNLVSYTRDASNEINLKFPKLPNPELVLYVYPHFTRKGHPVPGYSTVFRMYEKDEYALPGELVPQEPESVLR